MDAGLISKLVCKRDQRKSEEKISQYNVLGGEIQCYGGGVVSRYGILQELAEMSRFCRLLYAFELTGFVKNIFYDSKAFLCNVELTQGVGDKETATIQLLAQESFTQVVIGDFEHFTDC